MTKEGILRACAKFKSTGKTPDPYHVRFEAPVDPEKGDVPEARLIARCCVCVDDLLVKLAREADGLWLPVLPETFRARAVSEATIRRAGTDEVNCQCCPKTGQSQRGQKQ